MGESKPIVMMNVFIAFTGYQSYGYKYNRIVRSVNTFHRNQNTKT